MQPQFINLMHEITKTISDTRNNIFQKKFLKGLTIFEGMERRTTKMNISLWEMGHQILFWSFFLKKAHTDWMKAKNWFWRHPHIYSLQTNMLIFTRLFVFLLSNRLINKLVQTSTILMCKWFLLPNIKFLTTIKCLFLLSRFH